MKKIIPFWPVMFFVVAVSAAIVESCNNGDKKPETKLIVTDTTRIIDTTIIEPGVAPIADNTIARGKADKTKKEKISCGFNFKKFNNRKRPIDEAPGGVKGKKPKPPVTPPPPPPDPPTTGSGGTIYLDFWGGTISNTMWNVSGSFTVSDAGFAQPEIDYVLNQVRLHYNPYDVVVTIDETVFNATPLGKRVRVLITETYQWYGQAGGVAYLNSFFWTDNSPAFVFSLLLNYNQHYVAEAAAHEAGHTLGLRHQSDCSGSIVVNQYSAGKTMGVSYYVPQGAWVTGTSSLSCMEQNDTQMITAAVGLKQIAYYLKPKEQ